MMTTTRIRDILIGVMIAGVFAVTLYAFSETFEIVKQGDYDYLVENYCEDDIDCLLALH